MATVYKIENGSGYPNENKAGNYYWVQHGVSFKEWEICIWDGFCFLGYGLQTFERKINFPVQYQEIKKPK